ncbi:MAG TPA: peptidoglycan editing factor PgeF [Oscillospiraceae bacterium]|nr:peptidoglycan editing factor PgeF [Oscillospiraceae bacterium]
MYDTKNMNLHENKGVTFLTFSSFEQYPFIRHAFSTRLGGVSQNEFSSMNLSFHRGDSDEHVLENYRRFCAAVGFDYNSLVASSQDHHTFIRRVGHEQAGIGIWCPKDIQSVDGLVTNEPNVTLVTYYADCVPLYFLDPVKHAIGLAHAGWRGTVARIGEKMVESMQKEFGSDPKDIIAAIGPSIGPCCYEVDEPVQQQFSALKDLAPIDFIKAMPNGKYMLNLWEVNRRIMLRAGIPEQNIEVAELCTKCNSDLLFSHRVMGAARGGLAAMLALKGEE